MINIFYITLGIFGYIIFGYILKKLNIFSKIKFENFSFLSFNILLPIALITNFWEIEFPNIVVYELVIVFFGSGIIVYFTAFIITKVFYKFNTDDSAIFGLGSCFGNSVALGIPLMYSILGPIDVMPYMILVLFHGFIYFSYTTLIIETYRNRKSSPLTIILKTLFGLSKNIVLFGMIIGIFFNYMDIPFPNDLKTFLIPISKFALPAVLISLGIALANFKIIKEFKFSLILTILKNIVHPLIGFILAKYIFLMPNLMILIVTLACALPSGSQTYYFSFRYNSLQSIISANVLLSTFVSFITISLILLLFGY